MKNILCRYAAIVVPLIFLSTNAFSLTKPSAADLQKGYDAQTNKCQSQTITYVISAATFKDDDNDGYAIVNLPVMDDTDPENPVPMQRNPVAYVEMPESKNFTAVLSVKADSAIICIKAANTKAAVINVDGLTTDWTSVAIHYWPIPDNIINDTNKNYARVIQFDSRTDSGRTSGNYDSTSKDSIVFLGKASATTYVYTGGGNDDITGSTQKPYEDHHRDYFVVNAGDGKDTIKGSAGDDQLNGDGSDDTIEGMAGYDIINGGSGKDSIYLNKYKSNNGTYNWSLENGTESGSFTIKTSLDTDGGMVDGGSNDDVIWGSNGDDILYGGSGNDSIYGLDGDDEIKGEDGNDRLFGMDDSDNVSGGNGTDYRLPSATNGKKD